MKDITITSLETITAFGLNGGEYLFTLDELQNASIAQGQEQTDITGKQGRKLATLKRNKTVTISGANGLVSGGLFEMQNGSSFEKSTTTTVMWADYITVGDTTVPHYTPVGTVGSEFTGVYKRNGDGSLGDKLTQTTETPTAGKFSYDATSKEFTFGDTFASGTELVAYYKRNISADKLTNYSDKYSNKCSLYIDALAEDKCGTTFRVQIYIPKADFSGEWTMEMGDNQTIHNFEAEALSGACGTAGEFFTYTVFGANTEDVAVTADDDGDGTP